MIMKVKMFCFVAILLFASTHITSGEKCNPLWSKPGPVSTEQLKNKYYSSNKDDVGDAKTLRLVNVVFRHGDRTPDANVMYPKDPYINYTYYPVGHGQLTNLGKEQEYNIGLVLRSRYGEFLGDIYTSDVQDARSTNINRTKASLELALAGLWPPVEDQIWNKALLWQPIPYNYWQMEQDEIMGDPTVACPYYKKIYDQNLNSPKNLEENEKLADFYEYVNYHTGLNTSIPEHIYNVYFTIKAEQEWGLSLPEWTKCVWPHKFTDVAITQFDLYTQTTELKQNSCGKLLDKIIKDSLEVMKNKENNERKKIFLYSGHERNVAFTLISLGLFHPHMPPYSSYVLIELHEIENIFGVKVYYQDYSEEEAKLLTIPGCESFCPFDKFYSLIENNLPKKSCR